MSCYESAKKDLDEAKANISSFEAKLDSTEADVDEARTKIVVHTDEKENGIDAYMLTPEFVELMSDHDAQRRPKVSKEGCDAAVEAILEAHPEVFEANSFHCPFTVPHAEISEESQKEQIREGDHAVTYPTSNSAESPEDARG